MVIGRKLPFLWVDTPSENGVTEAHDMKCRTDLSTKGNSSEKFTDLCSLTNECCFPSRLLSLWRTCKGRWKELDPAAFISSHPQYKEAAQINAVMPTESGVAYQLLWQPLVIWGCFHTALEKVPVNQPRYFPSLRNKCLLRAGNKMYQNL